MQTLIYKHVLTASGLSSFHHQFLFDRAVSGINRLESLLEVVKYKSYLKSAYFCYLIQWQILANLFKVVFKVNLPTFVKQI